MLEFHRLLLGDSIRNKAFAAALKKVIKKGVTVVADIGSGTGFLSFLACEMGARHCYLYEQNPALLELSKKIAADNGIKNCTFIAKHSMEMKNPVRADIVISETLGNYALEENILETLRDARRFLKPGGVMIPQKLAQFVAPVTSKKIMEEIDVWPRLETKINFTRARSASLNNVYVREIKPSDLLQQGAQKWDSVDFTEDEESVRQGHCEWQIESAETIYGFALWWNCELTKGISLSTSPFEKLTHWQQIFLPLSKPLSAQKGEMLELTIISDSRIQVGINVRWEGALKNARGLTTVEVKMDMAKGL